MLKVPLKTYYNPRICVIHSEGIGEFGLIGDQIITIKNGEEILRNLPVVNPKTRYQLISKGELPFEIPNEKYVTICWVKDHLKASFRMRINYVEEDKNRPMETYPYFGMIIDGVIEFPWLSDTGLLEYRKNTGIVEIFVLADGKYNLKGYKFPVGTGIGTWGELVSACNTYYSFQDTGRTF